MKRSRISGNKSVNPYHKIRHQEIVVKTQISKPINCVESFTNMVNSTIDTIQLPIITRDFRHCFLDKDPESIIGNTGNTQGANIVSIHARKATR